jgi:hypothetical protein
MADGAILDDWMMGADNEARWSDNMAEGAILDDWMMGADEAR